MSLSLSLSLTAYYLMKQRSKLAEKLALFHDWLRKQSSVKSKRKKMNVRVVYLSNI